MEVCPSSPADLRTRSPDPVVPSLGLHHTGMSPVVIPNTGMTLATAHPKTPKIGIIYPGVSALGSAYPSAPKAGMDHHGMLMVEVSHPGVLIMGASHPQADIMGDPKLASPLNMRAPHPRVPGMGSPTAGVPIVSASHPETPIVGNSCPEIPIMEVTHPGAPIVGSPHSELCLPTPRMLHPNVHTMGPMHLRMPLPRTHHPAVPMVRYPGMENIGQFGFPMMGPMNQNSTNNISQQNYDHDSASQMGFTVEAELINTAIQLVQYQKMSQAERLSTPMAIPGFGMQFPNPTAPSATPPPPSFITMKELEVLAKKRNFYDKWRGSKMIVFVEEMSQEDESDPLMRKLLGTCGTILDWRRDPRVSGGLEDFGYCEFDHVDAGMRAVRLLTGLRIGDKKLVVFPDRRSETADIYIREYKELMQHLCEDYDAYILQVDTDAMDMIAKIMFNHRQSINSQGGDVERFDNGGVDEDPDILHQEHYTDSQNGGKAEKLTRRIVNASEVTFNECEDNQTSDMEDGGVVYDETGFNGIIQDGRVSNGMADYEVQVNHIACETHEGDAVKLSHGSSVDAANEITAEEGSELYIDSRISYRQVQHYSRRGQRKKSILKRHNQNFPRVWESTRGTERTRMHYNRRKQFRKKRFPSASQTLPPSQHILDVLKDQEKEQEKKEQREREIRSEKREDAYQRHQRKWKEREARMIISRRREKKYEDRRNEENQKRAEELAEFLKNYNDERDDPMYYNAPEYNRRLVNRRKEFIEDAEDRVLENEEFEILRCNLLKENHPDATAEYTRRKAEIEDSYKPKPTATYNQVSYPPFSSFERSPPPPPLRPPPRSPSPPPPPPPRLPPPELPPRSLTPSTTPPPKFPAHSTARRSTLLPPPRTRFLPPPKSLSSPMSLSPRSPSPPEYSPIVRYSPPSTSPYSPIRSPPPPPPPNYPPPPGVKIIYMVSPTSSRDISSTNGFSVKAKPENQLYQHSNKIYTLPSQQMGPFEQAKLHEAYVSKTRTNEWVRMLPKKIDSTDSFTLEAEHKGTGSNQEGLIANGKVTQVGKPTNSTKKNALSKKHGVVKGVKDGKKLKRKPCNKILVDMIPKEKTDLYAYAISWDLVDAAFISKRMVPWITKKVARYIGEPDPILIDYIATSIKDKQTPPAQLEDALQTLFDVETEVFVQGLWKLLIYEVEAKKLQQAKLNAPAFTMK